jgi:hypothetical protein
VARFGGDEFVVMLETLHADLPDAPARLKSLPKNSWPA